ncbi:uncharacterized protein BO80DRAFT_398847 [Aspergillus ibericus CBS 121593]|uniref:Uncharacterized protein n=1 Tax=Aspergillus ibericus CBS 121593 TaxID=1448316 RepID=A0A395HE89_9EURO|nr:hypothetical protein BO80DRAFT_398847 [Aspergillus ibericus CBS 121593]RAL04544.1 hypothetical protein BO80DRAFT_398847 [Aspergillus ibericus CBS 121593]
MSASIQSIVATPLHAVAESNIALAQLNFDFSLVKVEAPVELQPLGKQLSKSRRQSAEDGSFHILARRLGVLFDNVLPDVPALLEAYGTRASEIVQETTHKVQSPKDIVDGFFGSHIGIDSTTIWASATSGKSVLRIHLLACMLARIWSPQEATAIWRELVTHRQAVIRSQAQSPEIVDNYLAQLAAAHDIDGPSLGSWDASARAWLQVADQARKKEQIQIRLIVNNLSVAVKSHAASDHGTPPKSNCYDSVLLNLNRALTTLEKLIKGEPQRITDGGILLGLTSWHLYPDLVVLGSTTKEIRQKDYLVKEGGIVTISIAAQASPSADGVYWSLPLASLRYYGTVQRERSTMHDSRISVEQLQALALGASLGSPDVPVTAARILRSLWQLFHQIYQARMCQLADKPPELPEDLSRFSVVGLIEDTPEIFEVVIKLLQLLFPLRDGIDLLLSDDSNERKTATQLMRYGANYGKLWIGNKSNSPSLFFGLATLRNLLGMIKYPGARVRILRELCAQYQLKSPDYVIRFRARDNSWAYAPIAAERLETVHGGMKRKRDEYELIDMEPADRLDIPPEENWICIATLAASSGHGSQSSTSRVYGDIFAELLDDNTHDGESVFFDFAFGDHNLAAVYRRQTSQPSAQNKTFSSTVPLAMVQELLDKSLLRLDGVAQCLLDHFESIQPLHGDSLLALGRVVDYYKRYLPQATVSMGVIKSSIRSWAWVQSMVSELDLSGPLAEQHAREGFVTQTVYPHPLSREHTFAAILQFESGTISVDTSDLAAVLAISSGNSLFIAEQLLHDPTFHGGTSCCAVSHVIGNVGKPGVALLVSPPELEVREHDLERWRFVNHHPFNGSPTGGMFDGTSLHLSFTGWEGPVSLNSSSFRSMEAYYLETTVSVNDGGEWVGDVDILKGLRDVQMLAHPLSDTTCSHDPSFTAAGATMISIDCWEEILDPPSGILVLRSTPATPDGSRNWQWMVRLAAVSIASLRKYQCICIPLDRMVCWTCVISRLGVDRERTLLVY